MPKRKGRKAAKVEADPETEAKLDALDILLSTFREHAAEYEAFLNAKTEEMCDQITKMYQEKLQAIPEHIRKMTVSEIMELQEKEKREGSQATPLRSGGDNLRTAYEKNKQQITQKRTQKKEKKRSTSTSSQNRHAAIVRGTDAPRISRTLSESSLFTPLSKPGRLHNSVVTPKFNPNLPVSRMARRPRANEIVMSLSGSPLQCYGNDVSLSLGGGKVITFQDGATEANKDIIKELDESYKKTLENVKNELDKILNQ